MGRYLYWCSLFLCVDWSCCPLSSFQPKMSFNLSIGFCRVDHWAWKGGAMGIAPVKMSQTLLSYRSSIIPLVWMIWSSVYGLVNFHGTEMVAFNCFVCIFFLSFFFLWEWVHQCPALEMSVALGAIFLFTFLYFRGWGMMHPFNVYR